MRYRDCGSFYNVSVSRTEVEAFKRSYPCSGLPDRAFTFQFDKRNGDLVDIWPDSSRYDGPGLLALSQDAQTYGENIHLRGNPTRRTTAKGARENIAYWQTKGWIVNG